MVSKFKISTRLILLCMTLLVVLLATNALLIDKLDQDARAIREETRVISLLKTANGASKAFGELRYWLTDLAASLLVRSERMADEARDVLEVHLSELVRHDPLFVADVRRDADAMVQYSLRAADAYTENQRVLGNSLLAQSRIHAVAVGDRLAELVDRLELRARTTGESALSAAERASELALMIVLAASVFGLALTILVLRSITQPLHRLVGAMTAISEGDLDVEIPSPGRDEIGAMARTLTTFRDRLVERDRLSREHAQAEQALFRAQTQLVEAIEASSEAFVLYDKDDRLVICNDRYREMYKGLDLEVCPGTSYPELIRAAVGKGIIVDAQDQPEAWFESRLQRHHSPGRPYEQRRADGRWLRISEHKTHDGGVVGVFTDITEIKDREERLGELVQSLAAARDAAMEATRAKSQFLANMSHELRTPLNAVIGITEMLEEDARDLGQDDMLEPLQRISQAGKHLLSIINNILDLSKIEAGKMELHLESFDLGGVIRDAAAMVGPLARKNDNRLHVEIGEGIGSIYADITRVRQTVFNLLSNACKFTEDGDIAIETRLASGGDGDWIEIVVRDTGIGMDETQLARLFNEFSQGDASNTRKYGGTGLGLAISQRFCQMMGGNITVESEPGQGSAFTVRLPMAVAALPEPAEAPLALAHGEPAQTVGEASRGDRILVIDDDPVVRQMMERFFVRESFEVATANSGEEGLALAREFRPTVITLDIFMPDRDGWSVLQELKSDPDLSSIPVLLVSMLDERAKGFALGASDYLAKPIRRECLRDIVRRFGSGAHAGYILVVDDDDVARRVVGHMLASEGLQVQEAENGSVALDRIARQAPAMILLDLLMPVMDGFDFLTELRRAEAGKRIPVVIVTCADLTDEDRRRLNGGALKIIRNAGSDQNAVLAEIRDMVLRFAYAQKPAATGTR